MAVYLPQLQYVICAVCRGLDKMTRNCFCRLPINVSGLKVKVKVLHGFMDAQWYPCLNSMWKGAVPGHLHNWRWEGDPAKLSGVVTWMQPSVTL